MSAATRLRLMGGIVTGSAALVGISTLPSVRDFIARHLGPHGAKHLVRVLAVLFALVNLKNLPLFWHIRVLRGIFYHLYLQPTAQKPRDLFAPMITSSYNTPYDCDYNFHKSNSTYFADLDVARAHYMGSLIRTGLARLNRGDEEGLPKDTTTTGGRYFIALGAVTCFFQKQIEPLQQFEIYTRLLSWDRKWVYCVSHIVRKGAIKPDSYVLQPWKKGKSRKVVGEGKGSDKDGVEEDLSKHIFATSVARYVFKKGRKTINPEIVLERSRLLPPRPDGVTLPPRSEASTNGDATAANGDASASTDAYAALFLKGGPQRVTETDANGDVKADNWTWDEMEKERIRGLKIASHFDALSAAQYELRAGDVLGQYGDYW